MGFEPGRDRPVTSPSHSTTAPPTTVRRELTTLSAYGYAVQENDLGRVHTTGLGPERNRNGTVPGAHVHICSTASSRSGTSRPPRDVIAVERFRNGYGWLCDVNTRLNPFQSITFEASDRSRSLSLALIQVLASELLLAPVREIARYKLCVSKC